ncbi:hypothetical protein ALC57_02305, partial [Trachymyrmex cornetzi]
ARLIAKLAEKASKEFRQQQAEKGRLLRSKANYFIPTCRLPRTRGILLSNYSYNLFSSEIFCMVLIADNDMSATLRNGKWQILMAHYPGFVHYLNSLLKKERKTNGSGRVREDFLLSFLALSGWRAWLTGVIFHSDTVGEGEGRSAAKRGMRRDRSPLKRERGSETSWLLVENPISPLYVNWQRISMHIRQVDLHTLHMRCHTVREKRDWRVFFPICSWEDPVRHSSLYHEENGKRDADAKVYEKIRPIADVGRDNREFVDPRFHDEVDFHEKIGMTEVTRCRIANSKVIITWDYINIEGYRL